MLVEVLSDATREYDRGEKSALYKEIPTLREYMLVEQNLPLVDTFHLAPSGAWEPRRYDHLDAKVGLDSVGLTIPLGEIYRLVFT